MKTVAIHQPQYLPWLPYIDKIDQVDEFVYLDTVSYQKNGVQNRNRIKTCSGPIWLTVSVAARLGVPISRTPVSGSQWAGKHLRTIEQSYAKAEHSNLIDSGLKDILSWEWHYLVDLNIAATDWLLGVLGIRTRVIRASDLAASGSAQDLVLNICGDLGATKYLSGRGAMAYQTPEDFARAGIELIYQEYERPVYRQCFPGDGFLDDLSVLDLVLNCGGDGLPILRSGRPSGQPPS